MPTSDRHLLRSVFKASVLFCSFLLVGALVNYAQEEGLFDPSFANTHLIGKGAYGFLLFFGLAAGFSAIGFPRQLISTLGGYAFGFVTGSVLVLVSVLCGAILTFYYARFLSRDMLRKRFGKRIRQFESFLLQRPFAMIVAIRLFPVGNNTVTNLLAGISSVHPIPFFMGTLVGYIPQTIIFSLLGSGFALDQTAQLCASVFFFVLSVVLGGWLYMRIRKDNLPPLSEMNENMDHE